MGPYPLPFNAKSTRPETTARIIPFISEAIYQNEAV